MLRGLVAGHHWPSHRRGLQGSYFRPGIYVHNVSSRSSRPQARPSTSRQPRNSQTSPCPASCSPHCASRTTTGSAPSCFSHRADGLPSPPQSLGHTTCTGIKLATHAAVKACWPVASALACPGNMLQSRAGTSTSPVPVARRPEGILRVVGQVER